DVAMNIDRILEELNSAAVDYLLIGGVNFLLRHQGPLTYDVDVWVRDTDANLTRMITSLKRLDAEWGRTDATWGPVAEEISWLKSQSVFCLLTSAGSLDIFRQVRGLEDRYEECRQRAVANQTSNGVKFFGLSDEDMLQTQLVLDAPEQKLDRISVLKRALGKLH
ncbi:MAG: hypothetical protein ACXW3Z_06895, partial [Limisphaerales bacterium]